MCRSMARQSVDVIYRGAEQPCGQRWSLRRSLRKAGRPCNFASTRYSGSPRPGTVLVPKNCNASRRHAQDRAPERTPSMMTVSGSICMTISWTAYCLNRRGFTDGSGSGVEGSLMNKTTNKYSPEVREPTVRRVLNNRGQHESRRSVIVSILSRTGCAPQTQNEWGRKAGIDTGQRGGITTGQAGKMNVSERDVRELKQADGILRKASAYSARAALDRPFKR